jgi:hypothetical protein
MYSSAFGSRAITSERLGVMSTIFSYLIEPDTYKWAYDDKYLLQCHVDKAL